MEITIYDHQIVAVNRSKAENEANSIVYKDVMDLHNIDFEICAKNFLSEYPMSGGRCIGERNMEEGYFLLYTSGMKTKIVLKERFFFGALLHGTRRRRFLQLQKLIDQTKYTTYDLT